MRSTPTQRSDGRLPSRHPGTGDRDLQGATVIYSQGIANVLTAMNANAIKKLAVISAAPVGPRAEQPFLERRVAMPILERVFGATYDDMRGMEALLATSDIDWVSLRPPRLVNKPATGSYRLEATQPLPRARSLTYGDLAIALLDSLDRFDLYRRAVFVATSFDQPSSGQQPRARVSPATGRSACGEAPARFESGGCCQQERAVRADHHGAFFMRGQGATGVADRPAVGFGDEARRSGHDHRLDREDKTLGQLARGAATWGWPVEYCGRLVHRQADAVPGQLPGDLKAPRVGHALDRCAHVAQRGAWLSGADARPQRSAAGGQQP